MIEKHEDGDGINALMARKRALGKQFAIVRLSPVVTAGDAGRTNHGQGSPAAGLLQAANTEERR